MINAALAYAANGWPVLALHSINKKGICTCRSKKCRTPGKHPRTDLCPHGVKDATTDATTIANWPRDINIGVALGDAAGGVMAFDIDDSAIANALMHPDMGLQDETGIVSTGRRGCHIWFVSRGDTRTFHMRQKDGDRIGEVRGDGAYVVVPPSSTERSYRWLGRPPGDFSIPPMQRTDDPGAWVQQLLSSVDIVTEPLVHSADIPDPKDPIYPADIPKEIAKDSRLTDFRMAMVGQVKVGDVDRSGRLHLLTRVMIEVAEEREFPLTAEQIAGVLKQYDNTAFLQPKYARRANPDKWYWEMAYKELPQPVDEDADPLTVPTVSTTASPTDYFWDENDGVLYLRRPRTVLKVSNFKPEILEDVEIDYGLGAAQENERSWRLRFTLKGGASHEFQLQSRDNRGGSLELAIAKNCPAEYVVAAGMHNHLKAALQELSVGTTKRRRVFATTGWVDHGDGWVYLLPSTPGGISADGFDTSIKLDLDYLPEGVQRTFAQLGAYGVGVRPPQTETEHEETFGAFQKLVECGNVAKTYPIVLQILAGPLSSAGIGEVPPLVHVMGLTGSLKTSYCLAALSLMGKFTDTTPPPVSWSSTVNFIQLRMHRAKDLTLLIDDFKRGLAGSKRDVARLVNNYADRSGRGRATGENEERTTSVARGIVLSNGEDVWEEQASVAARTIMVDLVAGEIDPDELRVVQNLVSDEVLQMFGGGYLTWLAQQKTLLDGGELQITWQQWRDRIAEGRKGSATHLRLLSSLASLLTVHSVVARHVRETWGDDSWEIVRSWGKTMVGYLLEGLTVSADKVKEASPFNQVAQAMQDGFSAGTICLLSAKGEESGKRLPPKQRAEVVGYYWMDEDGDPERVLLTRNTTFGWFERALVHRRADALFSWTAFMDETMREHDGIRAQRIDIYASGVRSQLGGVIVPLRELIPDAEVLDAD